MIDLNDERSAQRVIEKACPKEWVRKIALTIFADAIEEANVYGRDKWAIRVKETARLVVGNYYVCTVRETGVWLALDDRFLKAGNYCPTMDELNSWGWMPDKQGEKGSYLHYKDKSRRTDFSINGRYSSMCPVKCVNRLCVVPRFLPCHQLRLLHHLPCSL